MLVLSIPLEFHHLEVELFGTLVINPEGVKPQSEEKGNNGKEGSQRNDDTNKDRITDHLIQRLLGIGVTNEGDFILEMEKVKTRKGSDLHQQ